MRIFVIDPDPETRELLVSRVYDATRRSLSKTAEVLDGDFGLLRKTAGEDPPDVALLGPGCYSDIERAVERFYGFFPKTPLAVVLENEIYATEALDLRKILAARIIPVDDVAQLGQFILDGTGPVTREETSRCRVVAAFTQLKGGVGTTSLAVATGVQLVRQGLSVALLDLNDVNPHLSEFARVGLGKRRAISEFLSKGEVPRNRLREIESTIATTGGELAVFGQPELYRESFHFKADVIEDAPSGADYIGSLLKVLREKFDAILIDTGASWGVSTFASLPSCDQVLLVVGRDALSHSRSLENLNRLYRESDDPREFDLRKWRVVLNGVTGEEPRNRIAKKLEALDLFTYELPIFQIPDARCAVWGEEKRGELQTSLIDGGNAEFARAITNLAHTLVPLTRSTIRPELSPIESTKVAIPAADDGWEGVRGGDERVPSQEMSERKTSAIAAPQPFAEPATPAKGIHERVRAAQSESELTGDTGEKPSLRSRLGKILAALS